MGRHAKPLPHDFHGQVNVLLFLCRGQPRALWLSKATPQGSHDHCHRTHGIRCELWSGLQEIHACLLDEGNLSTARTRW